MLIDDKNIDILLETFFEVYFLYRFAEKEVFDDEYQETEYLLLDSSLKDYLYILDILGFSIDIQEVNDIVNITVMYGEKVIKQTPKGVKIE